MLGILYDRWQAFKKSKIRIRAISSKLSCMTLTNSCFFFRTWHREKINAVTFFFSFFSTYSSKNSFKKHFYHFFRNFNCPTFIDHFVKTLIVSKEFDRNGKNDQKSCKKMIRSIWEFPALMEKFKAGNQKNWKKYFFISCFWCCWKNQFVKWFSVRTMVWKFFLFTTWLRQFVMLLTQNWPTFMHFLLRMD